jgi:hypothetical protein
LHVLGAAEFERSLIRERTQAGQQLIEMLQKFVADVWNRSSSLSPFTTKAGGNSVSRKPFFSLQCSDAVYRSENNGFFIVKRFDEF